MQLIRYSLDTCIMQILSYILKFTDFQVSGEALNFLILPKLSIPHNYRKVNCYWGYRTFVKKGPWMVYFILDLD